MPKKADIVNNPSHYNKGGTEIIGHIEDIVQFYKGTDAFLVGQVIKYLGRAPHKDSYETDLKKAQWYLNYLVANYD